MGPRLRSRGIDADTLEVYATLTLQWGRDFAVAESEDVGDGTGTLLTLQWGRDFAVAESERSAWSPGS